MSEMPPFVAGEYRPRVGLDSIYVAEITADELGSYVTDAPIYLAPAAEASQASTINTETIYADDQAYETFTTKGETAITLTVTNIPLGLLATLTGQSFDDVAGIFYEYGGVPPYFALMFRYRDDIDQTCVAQKGSQYFEIVSMDNVGERSEYIE